MAWVWIEDITLSAGEEVDEVAEGVNGIGVDRRHHTGCRGGGR